MDAQHSLKTSDTNAHVRRNRADLVYIPFNRPWHTYSTDTLSRAVYLKTVVGELRFVWVTAHPGGQVMEAPADWGDGLPDTPSQALCRK